jgi:hypothetical protein
LREQGGNDRVAEMGASKAAEVELAKVAAPNGRYMSCVLECYIILVLKFLIRVL